jgi:hypothetical protein
LRLRWIFLCHIDNDPHLPDVVQIREDEGLLEVETTSDDVLSVLISELVDFVQLELGLHQELFVVCNEDILSLRAHPCKWLNELVLPVS